MKSDSLQEYLRLRAALLKEKAALEARLVAIQKALEGGAPVAASAPRATPPSPSRIKNKLSLRQAIIKATTVKPLTKPEILDAVKKLGYRFGTGKPMASIGAILYANHQFKNQSGRFSPAK